MHLLLYQFFLNVEGMGGAPQRHVFRLQGIAA
jgi:hypothetical protein